MTDTGLTIWKPWDEFAMDLPALDIIAPPCSSCRYWKPSRKYIGSTYDGVQLCTAREMEHDFSCFRPKENASEYSGDEK